MARAKPAPLTRNPYLLVKEIADLHLRTNFQNLDRYYREQNQLLDFAFLEIRESAAVTHKKLRHGLGRAPLDLLRSSVTGPGKITFYRSRFDDESIDYSTDGAVRVRFFAGTYWNTEIGPNFASSDIEEWQAEIPESSSGGNGVVGADGADGVSAGGLRWWAGDTDAPPELFFSATFANLQGVRAFGFANADPTLAPQYLYIILELPESYVAGTQVFIDDLTFFTSVTAGNFVLRAVTTLIRPGETDLSAASEQHTADSTNAVSTTAYVPKNAAALAASDATGVVGTTALQAGDKLHIRVQRYTTGESSPAAADVYFLSENGRPRFTA